MTRTDISFYAGLLVEVLAIHKQGDHHLMALLIKIKKHVPDHSYRDKLYYLIAALGLTDRYYSFGIDGIDILISCNQHISHYGSEFNLQNLLLSTEKIQHFRQLFNAMQTEGWLNFYRFKNDYGVSFMTRLTDKCITFFGKDQQIVTLVAEFIQELGRNYLREDFKEIDRFVTQTGSNPVLIRLFWRDIFENNNWELATLITPESFDFLLSVYKKGGYSPDVLKRCIGALRYRKMNQVADEFYERCVEATDGAIVEDLSGVVDYNTVDARKRENDLSYIQSSDAFKKGLQNYFKVFGKKMIMEDDLFIEFSRTQEHQQVDSYFIFTFILMFAGKNRNIHLRDCLKCLENEEQFEYCRAEMILEYNYRTETSDKTVLPILEQYYLSNIKLARFGNTNTYRDMLLCKIYQKYRFKTDEKPLMGMVWLDYGGIRNIQTLKNSAENSLSQMIIKDLDESGQERFRGIILKNIRQGINHEGVLGTHIGLCRVLQISDAVDLLFELLQSRRSHNFHAPDVADIYAELGGSKGKLLGLFKSVIDFEEDLFLPLAKHLMQDYPDNVAALLLIALKKEIKQEQKILVARQLSIMGEIEGFRFLITEMEETKKAPYRIQTGYQVYHVDTSLGLAEIERIGYMLVDKIYNSYPDFGESGRSMLIEWLKGFAFKSEKDLNLVVQFLQEQQQKLSSKYDNTSDLNWTIDKMFNDFRDAANETKPIEEVIRIMNAL